MIVERTTLGTLHVEANEYTTHSGPTYIYLENLQSQLEGVEVSFLPKSRDTGKLPCLNQNMVPTQVIAEVVLLHLYSTELEVALSLTSLHTNQLRSQQRKYLKSGLESIVPVCRLFYDSTRRLRRFSIFRVLAASPLHKQALPAQNP